MAKAGPGLGFLGIAGLGGLAPLFFKKDPGSVDCDERDREINRRSGLIGFAAAYMLVGLTCMIPFFVKGPHAMIEIIWLPMIFMAAGIAHYFFYSVAILIQYGRGGKKMIRTQRIYTFNALLVLVFAIVAPFRLWCLADSNKIAGRYVEFIGFVVIGAIFILAFILRGKRQKVDFDERDILMQQRSIKISFVVTWILIAIALGVMERLMGPQGVVKAWVIMLVVLEITFASLLTYFVSCLIQHGRGGKENE
jgi:hypothetical protein